MANKFDSKNCEDSYHEGVERITGVTDHIAFKVPSKILENRKQFWSELFHKYTEQVLGGTELDISTFKPCLRESVSKSFGLVQYWVNTGYLPYNNKKFHADKDAQSETVVSLSEEYLSLSDHHVVEEKANAEYVEFNSKASSSSSSVDTAAYILSNTNTTNKAETMAIVEGAKHSRVIDSQCRENVEGTQVATDKQREESNGNIVVDKSSNSSEPHSPSSSRTAECKLHQEDSSVEENVTHLQETLAADANKNILPETKSNARSNQNLHTKKNLGNIQLSQTEHSYLENEITSSHDSSTINRNRKKLYTGRDSPVDLLNMKASNKHTIPKLKRYLHPALDFGYKQPRKYKICKQRKRKNCHLSNSLLNGSQLSIFSYKHKSTKKRKKLNNVSMTISSLNKIDDKHSRNCSTTDNSGKDRSLIERDNFRCINTKILDDESVWTNSKLNTSMDHVKKDNKMIHNDKLRNLCPVVYLKRLSKFDIEKYKRPINVIKNRNNLITRQLSKHLSKLKPAVCCSKPGIQEHKKSNKTFRTYGNINPVVILESLSGFEMRNYKTVSNSIINPVVRLTRLTEADICRYKSTNTGNTESRSALLPDTDLSQDIDVNNHQPLEVIPSNCSESSTSIINLVYEDTASDQSTLLFCKCVPAVPLENSSMSNLSVTSVNSSQTDALFMETGNHMSKPKPTAAKKVKIKSKSITKMASVVISSSDNRTENKVKRLPRNRKNKRVTDSQLNESSKMHLRRSTINKGLFKTKNVWESDTASSFDNSEGTSKRNYNSGNINSNNNVSTNFLLSDGDDDFVKLVHCPQDVLESKLKQHYEILNQNFNSKEEKAKGDRFNTIQYESSNNSERTSERNYNSKNINSNSNVSTSFLLSDGDDDFVKLVHCPRDVLESKLKQRYKILNQNFNSKEEKAKGDRSNTSNSSMKRSRKNGRRSKNSKPFSESTTEDSQSQSLEDFRPITPPKLPKSWPSGRGHCKEELSIEQTAGGSDNKISSNVGSIKDKTKSNIRRFCFKTKFFDSDSESFTV